MCDIMATMLPVCN